jgi:PAS domain S-box-containing protein
MIDYANIKAAALAGQSIRAIKGTYKFGRFLPPGRGDWKKEYLGTVRAGKKPFFIKDTEYFLKKTVPRVISWESHFIYGAGGSVAATFFSGNDITELVKTGKLLKESEEKYSVTLDTASSAIASVDANGRILDYNRASAELLGINRKEMTGKTFKSIMKPDSFKNAMNKLRDIIGRGYSYDGEYKMIRKNGDIIDVMISSSAVRDSSGKFIKTISVLEDITRRRNSERQLKEQNDARILAEQKIEESEKFYRELFNSNNDAIIIMELVLGNQPIPMVYLLDFNEMACRTFDVTRQELLKKKVSDFIGQPFLDRIRSAVSTLKPGDTGSDIIEITTGKGRIITCELRLKIFSAGGKQLIFSVLRDITERLANEKALRESEELYRTLVATSPDAVIMSDLEGRITFASDRMASMYGCDANFRFGGKSILDFVDEGSAVKKLGEFFDFSGGPTAITEYTALRRNMTRFTGEMYSSVIKDMLGRPKAVISAIRDITERRKMEEALKESETKYKSVISQTGHLVYEYTIRNGIIQWSGAIEEITGYTEEEFNREVSIDIWEDMIHPDDRAHAMVLLAAAQRERGKYRAEYRFRTKNGGYIYMEDEGVFLADDRGKVYEMLGVMKDISVRKKYETELKEFGEKFRSLSEQSLLGIAILQDDRVKYLNDAFAGIYGYARQAIEAWTYEDFFGNLEPDDAMMLIKGGQERKIIPGDQQKNYQFRIKSGSGTKKWIDVYVRSIKYEGRPADFITQVDISELKTAEEKLTRTINDLKRSNAELEQFAYVASHDLQEPLRVISSYVQLLKKRYGEKLGSDADDFIGFAVDGADRMQHLIKDLLTYSRVGTKTKERVLVPMDRVVRTTMKNMETVLGETGTSVKFSGLPRIMADETQMVQLVQNLMSNSVKFSRKDIAPMIEISAERKPGEWVFKFSDNGIGINSQYYEKIFIIFQRLHGKGEYPGTGIGLAICKKIVESHGGSIWLESKEGEWAAFYFSVPDDKK